MKYFESILDAMGRTPLVRINRLNENPDVLVLGKMENMNPGGSVKDRIGTAIIEDAERKGMLKPGGTIVEGTSGNTGIGLGIAAAVKGYHCVIVCTDKVSTEKIRYLKGLGAEVIVVPASAPHESPENYVNTAQRLAREIPNALFANQFYNQANTEAHYRTTGPEIWEQTDGKVTHFVAGAGTGGTISGVGKYLKEKNPSVQIVLADPYGSSFKTFHETGKVVPGAPYLVEGIGNNFIPETLHLKYVDDVINVTDADSLTTARRLAREEGIFCGGSAGTIAHAALKLAKSGRKGDVIVFVVCDTGERYLTKHLSDEWMKEQRLLSGQTVTLKFLLQTKSKRVPQLVFVSPDTVVKEAMAKMNEFGLSQLPVLDDGRAVGSLREGKFLQKVLDNGSLMNSTVQSVMEEPFPVLNEDMLVSNAAKHLKETPAALVKDAMAVYGIVTRFDLIEFS